MLETAQIFGRNLASMSAMAPEARREPAFGKHLRRLRDRSGLSQEEAARQAGVSLGGYRAWEQGRVPYPRNRRILAKMYGVPVGELESYMASLRDARPPASQLERIEARLVRNEAKLDQILTELLQRDEQELGAAVDDLGQTAGQAGGEGGEGQARSDRPG